MFETYIHQACLAFSHYTFSFSNLPGYRTWPVHSNLIKWGQHVVTQSWVARCKSVNCIYIDGNPKKSQFITWVSAKAQRIKSGNYYNCYTGAHVNTRNKKIKLWLLTKMHDKTAANKWRQRMYIHQLMRWNKAQVEMITNSSQSWDQGGDKIKTATK